MAFIPPSGREVTRDVKATYVQKGSTLRMQWEGAGVTTGTIEGNQFTMTNEDMVLVYRLTSAHGKTSTPRPGSI
jgi:hypothetical protein